MDQLVEVSSSIVDFQSTNLRNITPYSSDPTYLIQISDKSVVSFEDFLVDSISNRILSITQSDVSFVGITF